MPECFCASPRALYSPPLLFLPFPYSSGDHCYSLTSLHPKLPHAVPILTDCVAAASAEITTQHPGGEQPADGIDYLYCQNNQLGRMPTFACLDVGESEDLEWRIGRIFSFFFLFYMLQIWMNSKQKLKYKFWLASCISTQNYTRWNVRLRARMQQPHKCTDTHRHDILPCHTFSSFNATQLKYIKPEFGQDGYVLVCLPCAVYSRGDVVYWYWATVTWRLEKKQQLSVIVREN